MAMKAVPFVATTALGHKLCAGLQKVLAAAKAPVTFTPVDAVTAPKGATHLFAGPLSPTDTGELANKYSLTSRVTTGPAAAWYPQTPYPAFHGELVQNLYARANPTFGAATSATTALEAKPHPQDKAAQSLAELRRETDRNIAHFFQDEASRSLQATVRLACTRAAAVPADRKTVLVVTKPPGDVYDDLLAGLAKTESDQRADELRAGSVGLEVSPIGTAWPRLVMFPETAQVLVCAANEAGDQLAGVFVGLAGGTGMVPQQLQGGATVYTCANAEDNDNPTGALLAACDMLTALGHPEAAAKIKSALAKVYEAKQAVPQDLPGGKAPMDAVVDAVAAQCAAP